MSKVTPRILPITVCCESIDCVIAHCDCEHQQIKVLNNYYLITKLMSIYFTHTRLNIAYKIRMDEDQIYLRTQWQRVKRNNKLFAL